MAELILKIKRDNIPDPSYQDGDIICAFNDVRIYNVHAQHICNVRKFNFNSDGLRNIGSLPYLYLSRVKEFRFERINKTTVRRINLQTLEEDLLSNTPNKDGEYIDVDLFLKRRIKSDKHSIFGFVGSEIWFGGKTFVNDTTVNSVWDKIEENSFFRKTDHTRWPASEYELKMFFDLPVEDFSDEEANSLTEEVTEEVVEDGVPTTKVVKARKNFVNWEELISSETIKETNKPDVVDKRKLMDIRNRTPLIKSIVQTKKLT